MCICLYATPSRLNCINDFNETWQEDTLILEKVDSLLFIAIVVTHTGGVERIINAKVIKIDFVTLFKKRLNGSG